MSNKMALDALTAALDAMEHMANTLNNMDAVDEDEDAQHDAAFEAVRAAIAALQAAPQGWRTIETAPKNADVILSDGVNVSEGGWLSDIDAGADYEGQLGMAGWWAVAWPDEHGVKPTHWMPLPTPPKD